MATLGDDEWNNSTERGTFHQRWLNTRKLFCAPRAVLDVVVSSLLCPRVFLTWIDTCLCRCGRPLDSRSHHRAACAQAGVLVRRGYSVVSEPPSTTAVVWRFLLRACHFWAACRWPLTPLLCQPSIAMGPPVVAPLRLMVLSLPKRANAKSAHIPNWSAPGGTPGWWSSPVRLQDGGQTRHPDSCLLAKSQGP